MPKGQQARETQIITVNDNALNCTISIVPGAASIFWNFASTSKNVDLRFPNKLQKKYLGTISVPQLFAPCHPKLCAVLDIWGHVGFVVWNF